MPALSILIKPASSLCNMKCKYCFYEDVSNKRKCYSHGIMKVDLLEILIKKTFKQAEGYCSFAFQGGEPTLAGLEFFKLFIQYVHQYNHNNISVFYSIQTNGVLITDEWARFLKENNFLVGLSLDGDWKIHDKNRIFPNGMGSFKDIQNTIKYFNRHKVDYNILCVVTNETAKRIDEIYLYFKSRGFKYLQFIPCLDPLDEIRGQESYSLTPNEYSIFLRKLFDLWFEDYMSGSYISIRQFDNWIQMLMGKPAENCGHRGTCSCYYVVESDGSIYPCDFYVLDEYRLGNIQADDFNQLLKQRLVDDFIHNSTLLTETCKQCRYHFICRGGCKRDRIENYSKNYYCTSLYDFFDYALERMKTIADILKENH